MDADGVTRIRKNLETESTEQLTEIWQENDKSEYTEEALEAIRQILEERGSILPQQPEVKVEPEIGQNSHYPSLDFIRNSISTILSIMFIVNTLASIALALLIAKTSEPLALFIFVLSVGISALGYIILRAIPELIGLGVNVAEDVRHIRLSLSKSEN